MKNWVSLAIMAGTLTLHAQTYYLQSYDVPAPFPFDPYGGLEPIVVLDASNKIYLVKDSAEDRQTMSALNSMSMMSMMSMDGPEPPGGSGGGGSLPNFPQWSPPTNGELWLEANGMDSGNVYLNLHSATNFVYEIWIKTNLLEPNWRIAAEVFPSDTNSTAFTIPSLGQNNSLFVWGRDWTGITSLGNTAQEWWLWYYFHRIDLSDTSLDSQGNTLRFDYLYGADPNIINFSIFVTNSYVSTCFPPVALNITAGTPTFYAVSVDDTNYVNDASWQAFTGTNLPVNLGSTYGWHDVLIGLRGYPSDSVQTWQWKRLNFSAPPLLVITNPTASVVSQPMIQIYGYCAESLASISYDISNALGVFPDQLAEVTDQYFDTNSGSFTTNYFECLDVPLTNGLNIITLHVSDWAGNTTITNFNFTLDYSGKTNPPVVQLIWPQNGTEVSGSNFTCRGWVDDPTATVTVQVALNDGNTNDFVMGAYTNTYAAGIDRTGNFWLENLPLQSGTNNFTLTVKDAAGNITTTNLMAVQSSLILTINPVSPDSQLWQPTVNLSGTISATNCAVWVNGKKGHNNGDGTWSANQVPVNNGDFTATAYRPDEQQPDGSYGN